MTELKGEVLTLPKVSGSLSTAQKVGGNVGAKTINIGEDGATFIPFVSQDGVISWTNNKELPNPEPVNIKGAKGDKGDKGDTGSSGSPGKDGEPGKDGYTPVKGVDYFDGNDGKDGEDGYTPVKGKDYFTDADKTEMVSAVISALPVYDGEVVSA